MNTQTKVLIVEDDQSLRSALVEKFTHDDFNVSYASDGEKGLASALSNRPDIILLDILMPKMDGMKLMELLRADMWGSTVPVIILSNLAADKAILDGVVKYQPSYYFTKSDIDINDLATKVHEMVDK